MIVNLRGIMRPRDHPIGGWFRIKVLRCIPNRKHKKQMAGKLLNLGVRGPGEKPSWGETRSSGIGGSHPGHLISPRG